MPSLKSKIEGFSLIEISITISIIALIMRALLGFIDYTNYSERSSDTNKKIETVQNAILAYYLERLLDSDNKIENNIFPCPSEYSLNDADSDYARISSDNCNYLQDKIRIDDTIFYYGLIPSYSLEMGDSYSYNAWHHKMLFLVNKAAFLDIENNLFTKIYYIISFADQNPKIIDNTNISEILQNNEHIIESKNLIEFFSDLSGGYLHKKPFCRYLQEYQHNDSENCSILFTKILSLCIEK